MTNVMFTVQRDTVSNAKTFIQWKNDIKVIVRMVKSINKQVPTDLFRPYFFFRSETFFLYNFNYKTRILTTQYIRRVIKTKTDMYAFGIVISGY